MVRSIVGCGTLFGVLLVGESVVGCVSFCVNSFIAVGMGNYDSGVSSIIVWIRVWYVMCGHFVVLIHFVHLLQLHGLVFVYGQVVRHILLGPNSQRFGQLLGSVLLCWSIYILAFRYGR